MDKQDSRPLAFESIIAEDKRRLEAASAALPHGPAKTRLERQLRQLEIAAHLTDWDTSPGLMPPR